MIKVTYVHDKIMKKCLDKGYHYNLCCVVFYFI